MENRQIEKLDSRILGLVTKLNENVPEFKESLKQKKVYVDEDPEDVSIYPRVISRKEHQEMERICRDITNSAFSNLSEYIKNPAKLNQTNLNNLVAELPLNQKIISGNARYDFLKQGEQVKLIEMNMLNVGAIIEATESCSSIFQICPELAEEFYFKSPVVGIKSRLDKAKVLSLILLTRENYSKQQSDSSDRQYIKNSLSPIETFIVPENEYHEIKFDNKNVLFNGQKIDGVYLRHLDGTDNAIFEYNDFCKKLCSSDIFIMDHFKTLLLEDKDLRFLTKINPKLGQYIPKIFNVNEVDPSSYSEYVLKIRDMHCGAGVIISPTSIDKKNAILQERIHTNKFPIKTIEGKEGIATYDTGIYVSYSYDLEKEKLIDYGISGYLTRFSLEKDIVNLSQGGGLIPTLIEK
ncbi:MAG: hypothetical protein Q7S33_02560 [Nanoarchaeota archaeon]|nr:hypothetical protein [Nanoarchaeota archaeon]